MPAEGPAPGALVATTAARAANERVNQVSHEGNGMPDMERAIEVLAQALWHIDDGSIDEAVVIRALLEHAVAIAHGQWEPAVVRRVINEIVDDVLVAGELEYRGLQEGRN